MNRDEIMRMAHDAGFNWPDIAATSIEQRLERFADLIYVAATMSAAKMLSDGLREARAAEREACLAIADQCADADMHASMAANAIRARGDAK